MKTFAVFLLSLSLFSVSFSQSVKIKEKDLDRLSGAGWAGDLAYLDYSSGKKVSISCNLTVSKAAGKNNAWLFSYEYPKEPGANETETVLLSDGGKKLDSETVIQRYTLPDKTLKIVTQKEGSDNDKKALFRFTYLISEKTFSIKKEVRYYEDKAAFFERNEFSWKR